MTGQKFADSIGVNSSNITHIVSNRSKPSYQFLRSIIVNYPQISTEWLISGDGEMFKKTHNVGSVAKENNLFGFPNTEQFTHEDDKTNQYITNYELNNPSSINIPNFSFKPENTDTIDNNNFFPTNERQQSIDNSNILTDSTHNNTLDTEHYQVISNDITPTDYHNYNNGIGAQSNTAVNIDTKATTQGNINCEPIVSNKIDQDLNQVESPKEITFKREISRIIIMYNDSTFEEIIK